MHRHTTAVVLLLLGAALSGPAVAGEPAPNAFLEMIRSDLRSQKEQILAEALALDEPQGAAFWPLYRAYDAERTAIMDRRVALVERFLERQGTLTDAEAGSFAKDWFGIQKDRLKLLEKYHGRIAKAVSGLVAAQFVQVENALGMLIDLQIAAEAPLLE